MDTARLRALIPEVLAILIKRGADFATAEDAAQDALVRAWQTWPQSPPDDPKAWLVTTAWHRFVDLARADTARRRRESAFSAQQGRRRRRAGPSPSTTPWRCTSCALIPN